MICGKVRSQTGSCTITGTSSQRCSSARCHARRSGGTTKSERTKTNACVGRSRLCSARKSNPSDTVSAGAPNERAKVPGSARAAECEPDHAPPRHEREDRGHLARCRGGDVEVDVEAGLWGGLEAASAHLEARCVPAAVSELGEEARPEEDAVHQDRDEQLLDVLGRHVAARVEDGPRACGAIER